MLLALVWVVALLLPLVARAQQPATVASIRILSVSGCADQSPLTVNCSLSTTLRIRTATGFPASVDWAARPLYVSASFGQLNLTMSGAAALDSLDATGATVMVAASAPSYLPQLTGGLLNLTFVDHYSTADTRSPSFAGLSLAYDGPPTLTTLSGCGGSGCVPDLSVLTVRGAGFLWYTTINTVVLNLGTASVPLLGAALSVKNDSYMTLSLIGLYSSALEPHRHAADGLALSFSAFWYDMFGQQAAGHITNSLNVSFAPLPAPNISSWTVQACGQSGMSLASYGDCVPGTSSLGVIGRFLYDVSVTVGGMPCPRTLAATTTYYSCLLPVIPEYEPTRSYDVVVSNDGGNVTLNGLVNFTSQPSLSGVIACVDRGALWRVVVYRVYCPPGTVITLSGARFPAGGSPVVSFTPTAYPNASIQCTSAQRVDSETITCTLPAVDDSTAVSVYGQRGNVQVTWTAAGANVSTDLLAEALYMWPGAPVIQSVSSASCELLSLLQLTACRATAVITIAGLNLNVAGGARLLTLTSVDVVGFGALQQGGMLLSLNATTAVFALPYFDANTNIQLRPNVTYTMLLLAGSMWSNAFRLALTYYPANDEGYNAAVSSPPLGAGAIVGIIIAPLLVVALILGSLYVARRSRRHEAPASHSSDGSSDEIRSTLTGHSTSASEQCADVELI